MPPASPATLRRSRSPTRPAPTISVLVLMSGGASANWIAPAAGSRSPKSRRVTRALLASGASIGEINTVRKHLSRIKGGRLAARAHPARVVTLAHLRRAGRRSGGDRLGPDRARSDHARRRARDRGALPAGPAGGGDARARRSRQRDPEARRRRCSPTARSRWSRGRPRCSARPKRRCAPPATNACCSAAELEGEAREVAAAHARLARDLKAQGRRAVILSGGELTVTIRGKGRGGPNQEYALALAIALCGAKGIAALAADTDGTDGGGGQPEDPAGAFIDATHAGPRPPASASIRPPFLPTTIRPDSSKDSAILLVPGPTFTNVNDFRAILVDSP